MADEYQRVIDLPVKTSSGISLLSDYLMGIDASDGYQMLLNDLAKKIVEDYVGSSLGGSSRSLKAALDAVNTKIGNDTMGTTATSVTGAIAEHESDINGTNGINTKIGNTAMGTTATTLTGAVKEHNDKIGSATMGTTATTLTGAIAEHEEDISELNSKITALHALQTLSNVSVLATSIAPGEYYIVNAQDVPGTTAAGFLTIKMRSGYESIRMVIFYPYNAGYIYINTRVANSTGWNGWKRIGLTSV